MFDDENTLKYSLTANDDIDFVIEDVTGNITSEILPGFISSIIDALAVIVPALKRFTSDAVIFEGIIKNADEHSQAQLTLKNDLQLSLLDKNDEAELLALSLATVMNR